MSSNKVAIHRLDKKQIPESFANSLYDVANTGFSKGSPWTVEQIQESQSSPNTLITYATIEDKVVGFIMASATAEMADIFMVVVSADYKKQAIGTKLFEAFIQTCREIAIREIILETRKSNTPAIRLYERVGFTTVGLRKAYYSSPIEDAIIMKREIGEGSKDC